MAANADGIAALGIELRGVDGRNFAMACNMLSRVTVAGLAGDAAMRKRQAGVMVPRAGVLHLSAAHVAAKAACAYRQVERHFFVIEVSRPHIVTALSRIVGDWRLKPVALDRIEVGAAVIAGPKEI